MYLSAISQRRTFPRVFTYKMAAKISWRWHGTKLRHCHSMYRVCLFVCLCVCVCRCVREHISRTANTMFAKILAYVYYLWPWLSPPWQSCDTLITSGFVDGVIFAHNGQKRATRKMLYSEWLHRRQRGFDIATHTKSDPPEGSTKLVAESDVYDCLIYQR